MAIDDKTRTELEAAAFRRLLGHLRERTDVQNLDLMNLAGFCRNCLSNWLKDAADEKGVGADQGREPRGRLRHALRDLEVEISGQRQPRPAGGDEEGPSRALIRNSPAFSALRKCEHGAARNSCGRAVDERDVALTL